MANEAPKRSKNFNVVEVEMLMHFVKEYQHIIECKKSNTNTIAEKKEIWELIEKEFNSSNVTQQFRSAAVLRKKWENIKKTTKDKVAEEKKEFEDTGGGPPADIDFSAEEREAMQILGDQRVSGASFAFDCDSEAIYDKYISVENENDEYTIDDPAPVAASTIRKEINNCQKPVEPNKTLNLQKPDSISKTNAVLDIKKNKNPFICLKKIDEPIKRSEWKKFSSENLRQPKNPCLTQHGGMYLKSTPQTSSSVNLPEENKSIPGEIDTTPSPKPMTSLYTRKRGNTQDKIDSWLGKKANLAQEQVTYNAEKIENDRKLHVLKERKLQQEIDQAAEKHSLEVDILRLQKKLLEKQFGTEASENK